MKITKPQQDAIKFIQSVARLSVVNPYPVHRSTLSRLLELRIIELTEDQCDYRLTKRGCNIWLGIA